MSRARGRADTRERMLAVAETRFARLVFHYAGGDFSAALTGVDDVFEEEAVRWRFREMQRLLLHGVLKDPRPEEGER